MGLFHSSGRVHAANPNTNLHSLKFAFASCQPQVATLEGMHLSAAYCSKQRLVDAMDVSTAMLISDQNPWIFFWQRQRWSETNIDHFAHRISLKTHR